MSKHLTTERAGERVTVTAATMPITASDTTVLTGTIVDGRYPHLYLWLDTDKGLLRIPLNRVITVSS